MIRAGDSASPHARWVIVICKLVFFPLLHGLPQEVFDLSVDAAQLVRRPAFEIAPELGCDAEQETFAFFGGHGGAARGRGRGRISDA